MMRKVPSGFTMVELIVTMVIIGILAVVVLPRFDLLRGFDEIGYRDQVKATLEYARKAAVAQRRFVCVTRSGNDLIATRDLRDPDTLSISTANCTLSSPGNWVDLPGGPARDCPAATPANQICAPSGVTLGGASTASLVFSPLGVSTGGSYSIVANSATTATITVEAETGYVR